MSRRTIQWLKFLLIFSCISLGSYLIFNDMIKNSKPIVNENDPDMTVSGAVSEVASRVSPSIVGVSNLQDRGDMFNRRKSESTGSGVILDKQGHIVTNYHVVKGADRLLVSLSNGKQEEAKLVGSDPRTDLAVIKVKFSKEFSPALFGDSDKLLVGQEVVAIGNPLGQRFARSVTAGVVSGLNRIITSEEGFEHRLIQTDAAINPGNSGGALVNLQGEVVGINTIKIASPGFEGMGFSIPSVQVKMVSEDIIKHGKVLRPVMGIKILGEISGDEASMYNLPIEYGVVVAPLKRGPADKAGIKQYDVITTVDGKKVETGLELQDRIFKHQIGDEVNLKITRVPRQEGGKMQKLSFKIKLIKDGNTQT